MFTQWNHLATYFWQCSPVVNWCVPVFKLGNLIIIAITQAELRDVTGLVSEHYNKVNITIKWGTFPNAYIMFTLNFSLLSEQQHYV